MGKICCVCRENKLYSACLHRFPTDRERLSVWLQFCNIPADSVISKSKRLCSVHFSEESFVNPTYKERGLRQYAVPTLYPLETIDSTNESEPEEYLSDDNFDHPVPEDMEYQHESTSIMDEEPRRTVPPLRIKNVRSLHSVHIADVESSRSDDEGSASDNDNLVIDEMEEPTIVKDEPMIIEAEEPEGDVVHLNRKSRKKSRKRKSAADGDRILVIDGDTIGSDEYEPDGHASSRVSSTRHSINSDESMAPVGVYNTSSHSSKGSRRKSHHVPKQVGDVVFEEATILTVDDDDDDHGNGMDDDSKEDERNDPNRNLMKNIAMLRTCINYVLVQQNCRPMSFKHNFESTSRMIEYYNQLKANKK